MGKDVVIIHGSVNEFHLSLSECDAVLLYQDADIMVMTLEGESKESYYRFACDNSLLVDQVPLDDSEFILNLRLDVYQAILDVYTFDSNGPREQTTPEVPFTLV